MYTMTAVRLILPCSVLLMASCTTTNESDVSLDAEASSLQCVGYCDLVITDRRVEIFQKTENDNERRTGSGTGNGGIPPAVDDGDNEKQPDRVDGVLE